MVMKALNYVGQKMKTFRAGSAMLFSFLALVVVMGVVQASGPTQTVGPPSGGMWWMGSCYCLPWQPTPKIHILAVVKNDNVTFDTEDFPENEDFVVTMGYMYTRGVEGYVVGDFNSGDGEPQKLTFDIPQELMDEYKISVRVQTDHTCPYYAFNWFFNNSTIDDG